MPASPPPSRHRDRVGDDYTDTDIHSLLGDLDPVVAGLGHLDPVVVGWGWGHLDPQAHTDCHPSGEMKLNFVMILKMEEMNNI